MVTPAPRTYVCPACGETVAEAPGVPFLEPPTHTHHPSRKAYVMREVTTNPEERATS